MSKIVSLAAAAATRPANPDIVAFLEEALERARAGALKFVILTEGSHDDTFCHSSAGEISRIELIGFLAHTNHKLHAAVERDSEPR